MLCERSFARVAKKHACSVSRCARTGVDCARDCVLAPEAARFSASRRRGCATGSGNAGGPERGEADVLAFGFRATCPHHGILVLLDHGVPLRIRRAPPVRERIPELDQPAQLRVWDGSTVAVCATAMRSTSCPGRWHRLRALPRALS
jgi:hypothetical protein